MALLDFPTNPQLNDTTTQNGNTWKWNGTSWIAFNNLSLTSQVTGVLGTIYGGTGKALSGLAVGSVLYADSSTSFAALAPGTSNYVLATQGNGNPPYWKIDDSGTGSVGNGTTGGFSYYTGLNSITSGTAFSYIVGPGAGGTGGTIIITSSTMALIGATITAGTWAGSAITAKYGGTGLNAISAGQLIYGSAADTYSALSHPGSGYALTSLGSTVAWQQVSTLIVASAGNAGWAITAGSATTTANIYGGGAGSIPYNTAASTTTFLSHSGFAASVLVTTASGIAWTAQNSLFVGSASTAAQLNISQAAGVGVSYLLFANGQSGNRAVSSAVGITVNAQDSILYANRLVASGATASISTSTGALIVGGGVGIGGSLWTNTNNLSSISGLNIISGIVTSGTWAGNAITLLYGGTNGTNSGIALSYQLAVYNSTGTAITQILSSASTGNSILLQSAQNAFPQWVSQSTLIVGGATTAAQTVIADDTSSSTAYITWVGGTSGNQAQKVTSTKLTFAPNTGILSANAFSGSGASLTDVVNAISAGNNFIRVSASTGSVNIANLGVQTLTGTANQVLVNATSGSATTGAITLTLPQDIGTGSSPEFTNIIISNGSSSTLTTVGSNPTSMVNKQYVDNLASGLDIHASVRAIQTSAIGASYFQPQAAGTAATGSFLISTTQVAFPAIDGVTFTSTGATQRVIIAGGATGGTKINGSATWGTLVNQNVVNGIYYVGSLGGAGTSNWILVRAADTDESTELTAGTFAFVEEGDLYKDTGWVCTNDTTNNGPIQFGLDNATTGAITFTQFTGAAALTMGQGLVRSGNTIGVKANIDWFGPLSNLTTGSGGAGYSSFTIGGFVSGVAGTSFSAALRVGTATTYGSGTAAIVLNETGFSMTGGTNSSKTLTITGDISIPNPGGTGRVPFSSDSNTLSFLTHSGSATSVLVTTASGIAWTTQNSLFVGSASTAAQLNISSATGVGVSYLLFANGQSGNRAVSSAVGITVNAQDSILYSNRLVASGTTASISTSTGALIVGGGVGIGGSLWTNTNSLSSISGLTIISGIVTSGSWAGNAITLLYGGTNGTNSGTALSYQLAVYNSTGTAITQILSSASTGNSILLQSAQNAFPQWVSQSTLLVGSATTSAAIVTDSSIGTRYLIGTLTNSGSANTTLSTGSGITVGNNLLTSLNLVASGTTASISTSTGALVVAGGVGIGGSLWTNTDRWSSISGLAIISGIVTSGTWAGNAVTLLYGGTNNNVSGSGHSNKVAVYNSTGTAITSYTITQGNVIFGATGGTFAGLASTLIPVTAISDTPPAQPGGAIGGTQAGQLWWDSQYGSLKVYYNDGNTSQWVDAVPVLGSSGGGSSVKRSYVMTFGAGFTPSTGADTVQIQVPYAPDNTSKYYYIKRLDYRNESLSTGSGVSFYIDRHTAGNVQFASANRIHTAGAGAAASFVASSTTYNTSYTLAGSGSSFVSSAGVAASIISGDYLRLNFTAVNGAATVSVSMVIEEQ